MAPPASGTAMAADAAAGGRLTRRVSVRYIVRQTTFLDVVEGTTMREITEAISKREGIALDRLTMLGVDGLPLPESYTIAQHHWWHDRPRVDQNNVELAADIFLAMDVDYGSDASTSGESS